jgi:hypothetical protein
MTTDNAKVNLLATELVTLDPIKDREVVCNLTNQIWREMYSGIKTTENLVCYSNQHCEEIIVPLLGSSNNSCAYDLWIKVLNELCSYNQNKKCWRFDPSKAKFVSAFRWILRERMKSKNLEVLNVDSVPIGDDGKSGPSFGDQYSAKQYVEQKNDEEHLSDVVATFMSLAVLIKDLRQAEQHWSNRKRSFFDAFFTYDITKAIKNDDGVAESAVTKNAELFPAIEVVLLKYLMVGDFVSMQNVVDNSLKTGIELSQRLKNIANCYGVKTRQTIGKRAKDYSVWLKSVKRKVIG